MVEFILNLILLKEKISQIEWSRSDRRYIHLIDVLGVKIGSEIDFGVENGPRGKGTIEHLDSEKIKISFKWNPPHAPDFLPIRLLIGLTRPQTCRKVLEQATAMGVEEFHFFGAEKGERSYALSTLWTSDEWREKIRNGVEQAFASHLPSCMIHENLALAIHELNSQSDIRVALDNYESTTKLTSSFSNQNGRVCLAVGPERGWSPGERNILRATKFKICGLGTRVLRVETAVVSAIGILGSGFRS